MPIDNGNLALKGLDDLFSTEENRQEEQREQVQQIPIDALHPFTNHPFKVLDDEAMLKRLYYYPTEQKLVLSPENPAYEPLVFTGEELNHVHILGRAVAVQGRLR